MSIQFKLLTTLSGSKVPPGSGSFWLRFDGRYIYAASPKSIARTSEPLTNASQFVTLATPAGEITNLYALDGHLYLLKQSAPGSDPHTFMRSDDNGVSFVAMDEGLEIRESGTATKLAPTRMATSDGIIFLNAGGGVNFMSTSDMGKSWILLAGTWGTQMCYPGKFHVQKQSVVLGGECPLDDAYL